MPPKALLQGCPAFTLLSEGSLGPAVTHRWAGWSLSALVRVCPPGPDVCYDS